MDKKYSSLFEPFKIKNLEIKNRFFMAPMGIVVINENGAYTSDAIEYYVTRAKGGIGLIITGANWMENNSPATDSEASKNSGIEMTERIHAYGCKIFVQLTAGLEGTDVVPSSAITNSWDPGQPSRELTTEES